MMKMGEKSILTDDEIAEAIINYIDEDLYSYAVMIDGEWGCGKTYFINEYLRDKLESHEKSKAQRDDYMEKRVVYLSLYGVKTVEEVSKQILMESYLSKTGKAKGFVKKGVEVTGTMLPMLFDLIKSKGIEFDASNVSNAIGGFLTVKDSILIFDDLERCDCPINEILGFINTFVEHDGMKVIIVANQKEIVKSTYLLNQELKYLVAAHENILFDEKKHEPVDINAIKLRIEKLFGQNELYERVKEKLIGVTIYYHPKMQDIFKKLIKNDSIDIELQRLLLENCSFFEDYMIGENHSNLRTFQFYLSKISEPIFP